MQPNVSQTPTPQTQPTTKVPAPIQLTPEQLRQVSGAGLQQTALPGGSW